MTLKQIISSYMQKVKGIEEHCDRCLKTERWSGKVILMVVDAAFTSIGLNYFTTVVPKVQEFKQRYLENGRITNLKHLADMEIRELKDIWRNERSWRISKEIASNLSSMNNDKLALRTWAKKAKLEDWYSDSIGKINGVGINTFQYLRMMGGVDTVMPDKIVKKVINEILQKCNCDPIYEDILFIKKVEEIAIQCGYRPIELCWMTWMVQSEGKKMRMDKYSDILSMI